jgi:hypothetical protein
MSFSVYQNGEILDKSKYVIDEKAKIFISNEDGLEFLNLYPSLLLDEFTFKIGNNCIFKLDKDYMIESINFIAGDNCNFDLVANKCNFITGDNCNFTLCREDNDWRRGDFNTFKTGNDCIFKTGVDCTFNTLTDCSFDTEGGIFNIWHNFKHIKTQGYVSVNIFNKGVISRLPLELNFYDKDYIIYYNDLDEVTQQGELLYTEDRLREEDFKMMLELKK